MDNPAKNRAHDDIWRAVQSALDAGMTVKEFKQSAAESWEQELQDRAKAARRAFAKG